MKRLIILLMLFSQVCFAYLTPIGLNGPFAASVITSGTFPPARTSPPSVTISALAVDWSLGNIFAKSISANSVFTFSNQIDGQTIVVKITTTGSFTVTWPTVKWPGGTPPTQTASGTDIYTFINYGGTIYGSYVQAMN